MPVCTFWHREQCTNSCTCTRTFDSSQPLGGKNHERLKRRRCVVHFKRFAARTTQLNAVIDTEFPRHTRDAKQAAEHVFLPLPSFNWASQNNWQRAAKLGRSNYAARILHVCVYQHTQRMLLLMVLLPLGCTSTKTSFHLVFEHANLLLALAPPCRLSCWISVCVCVLGKYSPCIRGVFVEWIDHDTITTH